MMDGLDWSALDIVCDVLGVSDPEMLINQLLVIRDRQGEGNGRSEN